MKPRRGVSAYIAVILLLLLAVSAGAIIYTATMGQMGGLPDETGTNMGAISLDSASITQDGVTAYLRNLGGSSMEIDRVYIDGVPAEDLGFNIEINDPGTGDDIVGVNEMATITVDAPGGFTPGTSYEVKILTTNNRQITFSKRTEQGSTVIPLPQLIEDLRYIDVDTSNVDGYSDFGTLTNFVNVQSAPDSSYATLTEARLVSPDAYDFIDIGGINVDGIQDMGTHSNFDNLKALDSLLDTLSEEDTGDPETGFRVYHGSFEFASGTTSVRAIGATVDPAHSFLVVYTAGTSATREPDEGSCTGYI